VQQNPADGEDREDNVKANREGKLNPSDIEGRDVEKHG
jgi:hypothetical protein